MTIRAIVSDIGGVLVINPETSWQSKWEKRIHIDLGKIFEQLNLIGKNGSLGTCTEEEWIEGLRELTGMSQTQTEVFMADLWYWYLGTLNTELVNFIAGLRPHYQIAILSNSFVGARAKEQEKHHFHEMTDQIIYSHEVGIAKPDKRIFELTCQRLNMRPEEIVFLDNIELNVTAALEYGIHGILFKDNAQTIADIRACLSANVLSQEHKPLDG